MCYSCKNEKGKQTSWKVSYNNINDKSSSFDELLEKEALFSHTTETFQHLQQNSSKLGGACRNLPWATFWEKRDRYYNLRNNGNKLTQFFMRLAAFRFLDQKFGFSLHLTLTILKILKISKTPVKIVKLPVEIVELPTLAIQGMFTNNRVFCTEMKLRLFHKKPFEPCFGYIFVVTTWFCSLLSHSL